MATEENVSSVSTTRPSRFTWSIGVRQVVYIALGIALYAILNIIFNLVQLPNAGGGAIALRPGIVIPLFFGVVFGPIVGLLDIGEEALPASPGDSRPVECHATASPCPHSRAVLARSRAPDPSPVASAADTHSLAAEVRHS